MKSIGLRHTMNPDNRGSKVGWGLGTGLGFRFRGAVTNTIKLDETMTNKD